MRSTAPLVLVLVLALLAGCGTSEDATTGPAGGGERTAEVRAAWEREPSCRRPAGASRWGCSVVSYRCQGVVSDRGWSISCARPGRSVAFTVRR